MTEAPPPSAPHATTEPGVKTSGRRPRLDPRPAIVGAKFVAIIGLAIWYLVRPEPLLVQREAESTRIDIAARVPGRLVKIAAARGQNVEAGATLLVIDNPVLIAELDQAKAGSRCGTAAHQRRDASRNHCAAHGRNRPRNG